VATRELPYILHNGARRTEPQCAKTTYWVGIVTRTLNFALVLLVITVNRVSDHDEDRDKEQDDRQLDDRDEKSDGKD